MLIIVEEGTEQVTGAGRILGVRIGFGVSPIVRYALDARRGIATRLHYLLLDAVGDVLVEGAEALIPDNDAHVARVGIRVPMSVLHEHMVWGALLALGDVVWLRWWIELHDECGRFMARKSFTHEYRTPEPVLRRANPARRARTGGRGLR